MSSGQLSALLKIPIKVKNKELGYFSSLFSFTVDLGKEV